MSASRCLVALAAAVALCAVAAAPVTARRVARHEPPAQASTSDLPLPVMPVRTAARASAAMAPAPTRTGARASAAAPVVQSMVVGIGGAILSSARWVSAGATAVRVRSRSCTVAAGTPLAVLVALRATGGPAFALRDYGHCDGSARNSGQLFVYSIGGQSNGGRSGWEYKVDGVSGSTGAGDQSGFSGNGRLLRSGDRVLWFWCQASGGGCQRTLQAAPSSSTVSRGASFAVTVRGYDNEGRGAPVAGAIVKLDSDFASTSSGGRATLIAPRTPGRYQVTASRRGFVPSFPETIVVR
jgi:hypothetical protein